MRNVPINNHPLVGSEPRVYHAHLPAYDPDSPENKPGHPDYEPGTLVVGNGMTVGIKAVFQNWNEVPGLDMLYVYCFATGMHTHVTPFDLGLCPLDPDNAETAPFKWIEMTPEDTEAYTAGQWSPGDTIETEDGVLYPDYLARPRD